MSKNELLEVVRSPRSELMKIKIGQLVRATMPLILEMELLSDLEVRRLTTDNYSKLNFDMNYPVLRLVDESLTLLENRTIGEYTRYYAKPYQFKGSRYLISSEWYDRNQEDYIRWLKRKINPQ